MQILLEFYRSTIGKKIIMAVTGVIGFGFVFVHMLGNLQFFLSPTALDEYGRFLRSLHGLLWVLRFVLVIAVIVHIVMAYQLTRISQKSRNVPYKEWTPAGGSTYASRTMRWSGPILGLYIIYHLLDITFGKMNPDFHEGEVTHNVIASFSNWYISAIYIVAMVLLGLHLYHGIWSMFQSMGLNSPKYNSGLRAFAAIFTVIIVVGFVAVPIAVLAGFRP